MTHRSVYRRLLRLYPASFRRHYGESMVQLFCDQLRDEAQHRSRAAATRVWWQTLRDLAVSIPRQRIEVFMSKHQRASRLIVAIIAIASAVAALAFAVPTLLLLGVLAAWLASEQARGRLLRLPGQRKWYRWVVGGGAVIAVENSSESRLCAMTSASRGWPSSGSSSWP
jgi:hypothetical protein